VDWSALSAPVPIIWVLILVGGSIVIWVALGGLGLVVLIVGSMVEGFVRLVFAPHREVLSQNQFWLLAILGIIAFVATLAVAATVGGGWFVAPIAMWLLATTIVRNSAPERETKQQRIAREASERKRAAARKAVAERKRLDVFGKDGIGLMERAKLAVDTVMTTEAVREGWLGEPGDLDFSADLALITETLRQARRIEKVAAESKAIPQPNGDDKKLLRDAERTVKQLRELGEGVDTGSRQPDVALEMVRSADGSILMLPATAA
jgi:hypothetical protein